MGPVLAKNENMTEFLGSYGDQPDFIRVTNLAESELNHVLGTCRNARLQASISKFNLLLPTLRTLGPRLEKIKNTFYMYPFRNAEESAAARRMRPYLKVLHANQVTVEGIRACGRSPKHHLKELRIYSKHFTEEDEDSRAEGIQDIITEGTKDVEIFHFHYILDNISDKHIGKNKSTLLSFSITNEFNHKLGQRNSRDIIGKLQECSFWKKYPSKKRLPRAYSKLCSPEDFIIDKHQTYVDYRIIFEGSAGI